MQTLVMYGGIIGASQGPGALFSPYCPHLSIFVVAGTPVNTIPIPTPSSSSLASPSPTGLNYMIIGVTNIALMVLAFDAYRRQSVPRASIVVGTHVAMSLTVIPHTHTLILIHIVRLLHS